MNVPGEEDGLAVTVGQCWGNLTKSYIQKRFWSRGKAELSLGINEGFLSEEEEASAGNLICSTWS